MSGAALKNDTGKGNRPTKRTAFASTNWWTSNSGVALLLAVLLGSVLISLGIAMMTFARKEVKLSRLGSQSRAAFYAAETGLGCALYWGLQENAFDTSTTTDITCLDQMKTVGGSDTSTFSLNFPSYPYCVEVTVDKSGAGTVIESHGYNTCDPDASGQVERAVRAAYD